MFISTIQTTIKYTILQYITLYHTTQQDSTQHSRPNPLMNQRKIEVSSFTSLRKTTNCSGTKTIRRCAGLMILIVAPLKETRPKKALDVIVVTIMTIMTHWKKFFPHFLPLKKVLWSSEKKLLTPWKKLLTPKKFVDPHKKWSAQTFCEPPQKNCGAS